MVVGLLAVGLAAAIANTYAPKSTADLFEKVSKEVQQLLQSTVEHKAIEQYAHATHTRHTHTSNNVVHMCVCVLS